MSGVLCVTALILIYTLSRIEAELPIREEDNPHLSHWQRPSTHPNEFQHLWKPSPAEDGLVVPLISQNSHLSPHRIDFVDALQQLDYYVSLDEDRARSFHRRLRKRKLSTSRPPISPPPRSSPPPKRASPPPKKTLPPPKKTLPPPKKTLPPPKKTFPPPKRSPPPKKAPPPVWASPPPRKASPPPPAFPKVNLTQTLVNSYTLAGAYLVPIFVGTPAVRQLLMFDTGADLNWFQCTTCQPNCFDQNDRLFDPRKSSTYAPVSCKSPTCLLSELDSVRNKTYPACVSATDSSCQYLYYYYSLGSVYGKLATETFTMNTSKAFGTFQIPKINFGCTSVADYLGGISGILGMGRGELSFGNQISPYTGRDVFSTCMTEVTLENSTSQVVYGPAAIPPNISFTPLIDNPFYDVQTQHFVNPTRILVGGITVPVPRAAFDFNESYGGGFMLDTGTTLAYFDRRIFGPVFAQVLKMTTAQVYTDPNGYYIYESQSLCWHNSSKAKFPNIEVQFQGGASIVLYPYIYLQPPYVDLNAPVDVLCNLIGLLPSGWGSIFGGIALQNQLVVWDRSLKRIGLKSTNCATGKYF